MQAAQQALTAALAEDHAQHRAAATAALARQLALLGLALALLGFTGWFVARRVVRPLRAVVAALRGLTEGRLDTPVPAARGRDEVASLIAATEAFRAMALAARQHERERAALEAANADARAASLKEVAEQITHATAAAVGQVADRVAGLRG
ncbi:HAMP domain-containing protein, partial [Paracraurococcus ruber]